MSVNKNNTVYYTVLKATVFKANVKKFKWHGKKRRLT